MEKNSSGIQILFEPRSFAVIGASHDTDKIGYKILNNIVSGGYAGTIYPVNPQGGELLGSRSRCQTSLRAMARTC